MEPPEKRNAKSNDRPLPCQVGRIIKCEAIASILDRRVITFGYICLKTGSLNGKG